MTKKIFIDLGAHIGKTLKKALRNYPDFTMFIGFEPIPKFYNKLFENFQGNQKVFIYPSIVGNKNQDEVKLYIDNQLVKTPTRPIGSGSSVFVEKQSGKISNKDFIFVKQIDIAEYITENFNKQDYIILKLNVEGAEYDILEHLLLTKVIHYIDKIYCCWHYKKSFKNSKVITEERQKRLINQLNELGFHLTGDSKKDGFIHE